VTRSISYGLTLALLLSLACLACTTAAAQPPPPAFSRALSLRTLQSHLQRAANGEPRPQLLSLCGITHLTGYLEDRKNKDLILVGEVRDGAPALHTQDLAVALRAAWLKYATRQGNRLYYQNPGCSIDPHPAVIQQLKDLGDAAEAGAFETVDQQMQLWSQICSQPQNVRVMGVPGDSHFAKVMVDADYLMKQLVDGSVSLDIPGFASLTDASLAIARADLEKGAPPSLPALSLNRFWFYPGKPGFLDQDGLITIERCPVVLLTEEEHLTREGIEGKGKASPLAAAFAQSFSDHYPEIADRQPIYRELAGLFRLYALAKALRYQQVQADLSYLLTSFPVPATQVPRALPGLSRLTQLQAPRPAPGGYQTHGFWMPTCGGVAMDFDLGPANFTRAPRPTRAPARAKPSPTTASQPPAPTKSQVLKARPSPDALFWDLPAGR